MSSTPYAVQKNYRVHVLDITDLVQYYEQMVYHYIDSYILNHKDVNLLFDYLIHASVSYIVGYNLKLNGTHVQSNYIDHDVYSHIFRDIAGEHFINTIDAKLKNFGILINANQMLKIHNKQVAMPSVSVIKLTVVGNALWIFEGI
jgi:hypothetical protein